MVLINEAGLHNLSEIKVLAKGAELPQRGQGVWRDGAAPEAGHGCSDGRGCEQEIEPHGSSAPIDLKHFTAVGN